MSIAGRVVVVGATGVVGGEILELLAERGHPEDGVTAVASERSAGAEAEFGAETLEVEKVEADAFRNAAVVFLATPPEVSRELASRAQAAGAWAIDASAAFRADTAVPLAIPGRPVAAPSKGRIVRCASPVSAALVALIEPLKEAFGVSWVSVTALLGAGASGTAGVAELERQTVELMSGRDPDAQTFPHRLAFNVVPQVGAFAGDATAEEAAWSAELARLWTDPPRLAATGFQVPGFFGHALSLELELARPASPDEARERLAKADGVKVLDTPAERIYPMPMLVSADASVHVGRVRAVAGAPQRLLLVAAFEGARRAALAAVDAAESLGRGAS